MFLFSPVIPTITLIAQMFFDYATLKRRYHLRTHLLVWGGAIALVYSVFFLMNYYQVQNYICYYLLTLVYIFAFMHLFEGKAPIKLFVYFSFWQITSFLSSTCQCIASFIVGNQEGEKALYYALYILCLVLLAPAYIIKCRKWIQKNLYILEKGNPAYTLFPIIIFILFVSLFGPINYDARLLSFLKMLLFEAAVIFEYYLLLSQIEAVQQRTRIEEQFSSSEKMLLLQKKYYGQVEESTMLQRQMVHDLRHHLVAIAEMCREKDCDSIENYINSLLKRNDAISSRRFCKNITINAILSGYITMAEKEGIAVMVDVDFPEDLDINSYDLCTILGNSIENAIEANRRISRDHSLYEQRSIHLRSRVNNGKLVIRIENTCKEKPIFKKGVLLSSKGALGGIGTQSIKNVVERYNGSMSTEYINNCFVLIIILIQCPGCA